MLMHISHFLGQLPLWVVLQYSHYTFQSDTIATIYFSQIIKRFFLFAKLGEKYIEILPGLEPGSLNSGQMLLPTETLELWHWRR